MGSDLAQQALNASLAKHKKFRKCGDVSVVVTRKKVRTYASASRARE